MTKDEYLSIQTGDLVAVIDMSSSFFGQAGLVRDRHEWGWDIGGGMMLNEKNRLAWGLIERKRS